METVIVTLKHAKAKKLLQDLEEMDLIQLSENPILIKKYSNSKISELRQLIEPMSEEEIDKQLKELRDEWERNF